MKKTEVRERKTDFLGIIRAFFVSDEQLAEADNEEEKLFRNEYKEVLAGADSEIGALENMLEHKDIKVRARTQRATKRGTKSRVKEATIGENRQKGREIDDDIER